MCAFKFHVHAIRLRMGLHHFGDDDTQDCSSTASHRLEMRHRRMSKAVVGRLSHPITGARHRFLLQEALCHDSRQVITSDSHRTSITNVVADEKPYPTANQL